MPFSIEQKTGDSASTTIFSYEPKFAEWVLDEDVAENENLVLPISYTIGKDKLTVTCNGLYLTMENFEFVGTSGQSSNTIKMLFPLKSGYEMSASVIGV